MIALTTVSMGFKVKIDDRDFQNKTEKLARNLEAADSLLLDVGRTVLEDVRRRVATGDGGSWAPASRWVQAKKGTTKALDGLENDFSFRQAGSRRVEVYFEGQNSEGEAIDIQEHHDGTTLEADGSHVDLYLKDPSALRLKSPNFSFRWLRSSVIPARRIWPDRAGEIEALVAGPISRYLKSVRDSTFQ